jgi:predicted nucleic acid-binding protein
LESSEATFKFLLDTSFILPTLGITVTGVNPEVIRFLANPKIEVYYSRFSLLESLWVATKISESVFDGETFQLGLRSITEGLRYKRVEEDSETFKEAFRLYRLGHKDMIDNILYASALSLDLRLLTLDDEFKKFALEKKLKNILVFPDDLNLKEL